MRRGRRCKCQGCHCGQVGATAPEEDVCSAPASLISPAPVPSIPLEKVKGGEGGRKTGLEEG